MQHLDEGTIHAWLDGADVFDANERANIEAHVASCDQCAAAVAEARGLIAGTSRILGSLDHVPAGVIPRESPKLERGAALAGAATTASARRGFRVTPRWMAAAAAAVVIAAVGIVGPRLGARKELSQAVVAMDTSVATAPLPQRAAENAPVAAAPTAAMPSTGGQVAHEVLPRSGPPDNQASDQLRKTRQTAPRADEEVAAAPASGGARGNVGGGAARDLKATRKLDVVTATGKEQTDSVARTLDSARALASVERAERRAAEPAVRAPVMAPAPASPPSAGMAKDLADGRVAIRGGCYEAAPPVQAADAAAMPAAPSRLRTSAASGAVAQRAPTENSMASAFVLDSVIDRNATGRARLVLAPTQPGRTGAVIGRWELVSPTTARVTFDDGRRPLLLTTQPQGSVLARPADDTTQAGTVLRRCP